MSVDKLVFNPCLLIPVYNHSKPLLETIKKIYASIEESDSLAGLSCLLINDGSDDETDQTIDALCEQYDWLQALHLPCNRGKGVAVLHGMAWAQSLGFTHALQMDADGQHDALVIPELLALGEEHPNALISGCPQYDESVPRSRLYGRYITHFWVWIETLSFSIKDSMCGFRLYPLAESLACATKYSIGARMDFDTDIMVKMYWEKVAVLFLPIKVHYPEDGISHFSVWKDNLRISWMHTRLVGGMLLRIPRLLKQKTIQQKTNQETQHSEKIHWSNMTEAGSYWGISFMFWVYRHVGRWFFSVLLYPVMAYFWLSRPQQRKDSQAFIERVTEYRKKEGLEPIQLSTFQHFMQFGHALLDKLAAFAGTIRSEQFVCNDQALLDEVLSKGQDSAQGAVFISSHLGNSDVTLANYEAMPLHFVALTYMNNTDQFSRVLARLRPNIPFDLVPSAELTPHTGMLLQEHIDAGHVVITAGDRTPINASSRTVSVPFMGRQAIFSEGPFWVASLLDCPVYLFYCFREGGHYKIHIELFAENLRISRRKRSEDMQEIIARYAARLEHHAVRHPEQWFNFYDFWQIESDKEVIDA